MGVANGAAAVSHNLTSPARNWEQIWATGRFGRNSRYRSANIPVRLELANAADADKNVRAPVALLRARQKP